MEAKPLGTPIQESTEIKAEEEANTETRISDILPYPQFLLGFVIGAIVIAYSASAYYSYRYGEILEAIPVIEKNTEEAKNNDLEIKRLVRENEENVKKINEAADKIANFAEKFRPSTQKVVNSN